MGLGHLFNFFFSDPSDALSYLSIFGGALAAVAIYLVGRSLFDRTTGAVAALLLLFSPMNWLYSEVALSYEIELPLVIALTWLLYQLFFHKRYLFLNAIIMGIAYGFRQDALLFLGPFFLIGSIRLGRRKMLISWGILIATTLAWFVPQVMLAGGLTAYRQLSGSQFENALFDSSVFAAGLDGLLGNLKTAWISIIWFFGAANVVFLYLPFYFRKYRILSSRTQFFLLILPAPAILFFILIFFRQPYMLVFSTPFMLLLAAALVHYVKEVTAFIKGGSSEGKISAFVYLSLFLAIICWVNVFLFTRVLDINFEIPFTGGTVSAVFGPYSAEGISLTDQKEEYVAMAIHNYDPADTVVIATVPADWRRLMYYLPKYEIVLLKQDLGSGYFLGQNGHSGFYDGTEINLPKGTKHTLFVELNPSTADFQLSPVQGIPTAVQIRVADIAPGRPLHAAPYTIAVPGSPG